MYSDFKLSKRLKLFLQVACSYKSLTLGVKCPVSIRKKYSWSQTIVIYPEAYFDFFTSREIMCFISLANALCLDSYVEVENGLPVITISDYNVKDE